VSCDLCHRLADPMSDEAKMLSKTVPPGYGNAMMVADPANVVRGPYGDGVGAMPHQVRKSPYHASGQLCGNCHTTSNPLQARDVTTQPPHAFGPIERTYSEWVLSDFARRGTDGSCQSCHYPVVKGGGQASRFGGQRRGHFVMHGPVGGSSWVQGVTFQLWHGEGMDRKALEFGKQRTRQLIRTAATLTLASSGVNRVRLRISNQTGHKLPTGYPEGRRMWLNVQFLDASGTTINEVGRYGEKKDRLAGETVSVPTLLDADDTRVYECLPGISEAQAKRHDKEPGKSFHFILNDMIVKDNRIPPKGLRNGAFAEHLCQPVGATYEDGQHWDEIEYDLPTGAVEVVVRLMYQSVSWEYVRFLVEQNKTDDWGKRLYQAWRQTGQCPPEVIAEGRWSAAASEK
jgi:hypothetical protein